MLRLHMELKGPFVKKMKKGKFYAEYFDSDGKFLQETLNKLTKQVLVF